MSLKKLQISIDLVEAALDHRQFLKLVDDYPSLYDGPHVQNAIRRYVCATVDAHSAIYSPP